MAKQIKGNEIIQDNWAANAVLSAEQLKQAYSDLDKMMLKIIEHGKAVAKGATIGSVSEIKAVTEAYNQTSAATKAAIELDKKLKGVDDELVKTKLKVAEASREQKERLKEEIALEEKQLGTLQKLAVSNKRLARERNTLNLETKEGSQRLKEINIQIDKNNDLIRRSSDLQKKQSLNVGNYKSTVTGLNGALGKLGIGLSVFAIMRDAFKTVVDFDKATQSLSAITGATGKDLDALKEKVSGLSGEMRVGIIDTTKLFEIVGSQMPQYLSDASGLEKISKSSITLSRAANDTIENSTLALTSLLNQFSLGAEDAERAMNVLAAGSLVGSVGITQLSESMKNAGSVLAGANVSIEESVALLEVLGKFGVVGAEAGTKLRGSMLKLQQAGIGYASGQFNINDALAEANAKMEKYGTAMQKDAFLQKTFGAENISTGRILLSNIKLFDEYTKGVTGTNVATQQAAINSDTMSHAMEEMNAAWENAIVEINTGTGAGEGFKEVVKALTELIPHLVDGIGAIMKELAGFLNIITDVVEATKSLDGSWDSINDLFESSYRLLAKMIPFGQDFVDLLDGMSESTDDLTASQRRNNIVNEKSLEYGREILQQNREEISDVSVLIDALSNENTTREEKNEVIAKLQADYPAIIANYDLENASVEKLIGLKKQLITQLLTEAIERKKAEQIGLYTDKIIELELQKIGANQNGIAFLDKEIKNLYATLPLIEDIAQTVTDNIESTVSGMDLSVAFRDTNTEIDELQKRIESLKSELQGPISGQRKTVINEQIEIATTELNKLLGLRTQMLDDALDKEANLNNQSLLGGTVGADKSKKDKNDPLADFRKKNADELIALENELIQKGVAREIIDDRLYEKRLDQYELELKFINDLNLGQDEYNKTLNEALKLQEGYNNEVEKIKTEDNRGGPGELKFMDALKLSGVLNIKPEKDVFEQRKKMYMESLELLKKLTDAQIAQYDLRIEKEKQSVEASKNTIDYLREQAAAGNTDAAESLKAEQIAQANQLLEIEKLERKKRNLLIITTGLEAVSQKINSGDSNAFQNAGTEIADFLAKLPKFYSGTEGTVAEALGKPHLNTTQDAYLSRLDGKEMVLAGDKVATLRAAGLSTTSEIANAAMAYSSGYIHRGNSSGPDNLIVSELRSVKDAIKGIQIPEHDIRWNDIDKSIDHRIKIGNKIVTSHYKKGGLFNN